MKYNEESTVSANKAAEEVAQVHNEWRECVNQLASALADLDNRRDHMMKEMQTYRDALNCALYPTEKSEAVAAPASERLRRSWNEENPF